MQYRIGPLVMLINLITSTRISVDVASENSADLRY